MCVCVSAHTIPEVRAIKKYNKKYHRVKRQIDKSMQIILERHSIDKSLTFNVCLLQLIFHTSVFTYYIFMQRCFPILASNSAEGCTLVLFIYTCSYVKDI